MCFKKLTIKNVLTCTLLLLTLCTFSLSFFPTAVVAENGSVTPPPPDSDTTTIYTSSCPDNPDQTAPELDPVLSTWDIIAVVVSTIL
jgi:hypothetical protein